MKQYYVYILTNKSDTVYYTGVTNDLVRRIYEHRNKLVENSFTDRCNLKVLVYYEIRNDIEQAIVREKKIKKWSRNKKKDLIVAFNPRYVDLWDSIL